MFKPHIFTKLYVIILMSISQQISGRWQSILHHAMRSHEMSNHENFSLFLQPFLPPLPAHL